MKALTPISASRRSRGFTLLELLLVCLLIALAAGLTSSFLSGSDQKEYSVNLRQVSSLLRNSRRQAIVTGSEQHVRLVTVLEEGADPESPDAHPPDWLNPELQLRFSPSLDEALEERTDLSVTFFPMGSSTGGLIELFDPERSTFLYVSPLTGKLLLESRLDDIETLVQEAQP